MTPDPFITIKDMQDIIREKCEAAGSQKRWAHQIGSTQGMISAVLCGRCGPSREMLAALKLRKAVVYLPEKRVRKGTRK